MRLAPRVERLPAGDRMFNVFNPGDPETGHPTAQLAVDFVARALVVLPPGYAYDLMVLLPDELERHNQARVEAAEREEEAARQESRDPQGIPVWPYGVHVHGALKVLSGAHKDLSK
jgi:hypothetical protein